MTEDATGILVTGATGNVGAEVCRQLAARGRSAVAAVSPRRFCGTGDAADPVDAEVARVGAVLSSQLSACEVRPFDFTDSATWAGALEGVGKVFLMRPPHISKVRRDMVPFVESMADAGIKHVVFLSVQGAGSNKLVPHHKIEKAIEDLGIPYTFVRPSFFMQNLSTTHLSEVRDESRIYVPAGNGATNFIDVRDIGEVIATTLLDNTHKNRAYTITGPQNHTYYDVADRLSRELGRPITYKPARFLPFIRYHLSRGRKPAHALVMFALYTVTRMGKAAGATTTFEEIVGRPPRTLEDFIHGHREVFGVGA